MFGAFDTSHQRGVDKVREDDLTDVTPLRLRDTLKTASGVLIELKDR